jgi:hypothetical protein
MSSGKYTFFNKKVGHLTEKYYICIWNLNLFQKFIIFIVKDTDCNGVGKSLSAYIFNFSLSFSSNESADL